MTSPEPTRASHQPGHTEQVREALYDARASLAALMEMAGQLNMLSAALRQEVERDDGDTPVEPTASG